MAARVAGVSSISSDFVISTIEARGIELGMPQRLLDGFDELLGLAELFGRQVDGDGQPRVPECGGGARFFQDRLAYGDDRAAPFRGGNETAGLNDQPCVGSRQRASAS